MGIEIDPDPMGMDDTVQTELGVFADCKLHLLISNDICRSSWLRRGIKRSPENRLRSQECRHHQMISAKKFRH
jgi:hypothetical protein